MKYRYVYIASNQVDRTRPIYHAVPLGSNTALCGVQSTNWSTYGASLATCERCLAAIYQKEQDA